MKTNKPNGKLSLHHTEIKQQNKNAIYLDVVFEDENKNLWKLHSSSFLYNLENVEKPNDNKFSELE